MNILILSPFLPYPLSQGGKIRVFNIIKQLSKSNSITLAAIVDDKRRTEAGPLRQICSEIILVERHAQLWPDRVHFLLGRAPYNVIRYSSDEMRRKLIEVLSRKNFDLVQIEFSMMWQYADIFKGIPVVLDAHNIEHEIVRQLRSTYSNPLWRFIYIQEEKRLKREEERAWQECERCFTASPNEKEMIAAHANGRVSVVPNGVDLERFEFLPKAEAGKKILLLGGMDYLPNLDSATYFLSDIYPVMLSEMPDMQLDVVGRELWRIEAKDSSKSVQFHEDVPDVLPFFRGADVLAVPLRMGAGTRVKILEAMAAGLPVVTTSKGCEGLKVRHGEHLLIADSPAAFSSAVRTVIEDAGLRKYLVHNARALVEERYSWEKLVEEMEKVYSMYKSRE